MFQINSNFILAFVIIICRICGVQAQDTVQNSQLVFQDSSSPKTVHNVYRLNAKNLIAPSILIGYGLVSLGNPALKELHHSTRHELWEHQPKRTRFDNYTQYAPAAIVYGLNGLGIKGKHNFRDRTIIYATSQLVSAAFVVPLKHIVREKRPDGSNTLSFPSGHTATAFSSAYFLFKEYRDENFWISVSGYPFAVFTGVYRTINDRHWVNDVVAGAGVGILSTELAYWLYPKINGILTGTNKNTETMVTPFYRDHAFGIGLMRNF